MVDAIDKIYYERLARGLAAADRAREINEDLFFEMVDCLYTGRPSDDETIQEIESTRSMQVSRSVCKLNAWRSVTTSAEIVTALDKEVKQEDEEVDESDDERGSRLRNLLNTPEAEDALRRSMEEDTTGELLIGQQAGKGSSSLTLEATPEEIEFRKSLANMAEVNPHLKDILKWFGVFYNHANKLKRQRFKHGTNITDVTQGNDLTELITSEFIGLGCEELETLFLFDFVEESLLQFEKTDEEEGKQGGVTLGIDISYSMDAIMSGSRIIDIAIGFGMAVVRVMADEDRPVSGFTFTSSTYKVFSPSTPLFEKLESLIKISTSGGTMIEAALKSAYVDHPKSHDVLIVTDGQDENYKKDELMTLKNNQKSSCLLVSDVYNSERKPKMAELFDTYIPTSSEAGFKDLMEKVLDTEEVAV